MPIEDSHIVAQVVGGRTSEFRQLVERYQRRVFGFAHNLIGNRHDAEDITQEVFIAAYDNLTSYDSRKSSLLTWLLTITRNRCINRWKRRRSIAVDEPMAIVDAQPPEADALRREFWDQLDAALAALPLDQKSVFVLHEIEQLSYSEISLIEKTTLGTVKSRLHRAKQRLRQLLGQPMGIPRAKDTVKERNDGR